MKAKKVAKKVAKATSVRALAAGIEARAAVQNRNTAMKLLTQGQMMADTFNVVHARICLNDGLSTAGDDTLVREKLFEIIAIRGWESTFRVMASCARLFAEVPAPVPNLTKFSKDALHGAAQALDAKAMELRHVDREATKGHKI